MSIKKHCINKKIREAYAKAAESGGGCGSCTESAWGFAEKIGYSGEELRDIPKGANLALGCGNPVSLADLKKGETVLDLGCGAGIDCFLAASKIGSKGKVIGVDMTPEMIAKARENAENKGVDNLEFRLGEIENLPLADGSVDVAISNCVINLSYNKRRVFQEIFRVLKPGGRIVISDIALLREPPEKLQNNADVYVGCVGGALLLEDYRKIVETAGFIDLRITVRESSACLDLASMDPAGRASLDFLAGLAEFKSIQNCIVSVDVTGRK